MTDALALLHGSGAIQSGHFELSSGLHSDVYVQKARILERPAATMDVAREIASWYERAEVVVAPAVGAVVLGFAVALAAGARAIFAERVDGTMKLRRGFHIAPGERTVVVEDVITTGGSAREVLELAASSGADVLGVATLIDRSTVPVDLPLRSVIRIDAASWRPEACPLCAEGVPLQSPGSRRLPIS